MASTRIGRTILLKIGSTVIAAQTSGSIDFSADTIDTTTKDTASGWSEFISGKKNASISVDGVFDESAGADAGALDIWDDLVAGTKAAFYFGGTSAGDDYFTGDCIITNFTFDAPQDDRVTWSASLTVSGAVTRATVDSGSES